MTNQISAIDIARLIQNSLSDLAALAHWSGDTLLDDEDLDYFGYNTHSNTAPFWGYEFRISNIRYRIIYELNNRSFSLYRHNGLGDNITVDLVVNRVDSINALTNFLYNNHSIN